MIAAAGIFGFWFLGLLVLAVIWRNYIDLGAISMAFLVEDVLSGNKSMRLAELQNVMEAIAAKSNEKQA